MTLDRLLEILEEFQQLTPDQSTWDIWNKYFFGGKGTCPVCPTALIEFEYNHVLNMEALSEKYGTLPYLGALLDQPNKLIECFITIQDARAEWERKQMEDIKEKQTKAKGGR